MVKRKLAIFDVDGTLIDSREMIGKAMNQAFKRAGLAGIDYEQTRQIVGLELYEAVSRLAPDDFNQDQVLELGKLYKQAFIDLRTIHGFCEPLYEGAENLLNALTDSGWMLGVATGKARKGLDIVFGHHRLHRYFQTFQTVDHGPGKPDPHMINCALSELGLDQRDALMIGDTSWDMIMANAAGVRAVGVSWGFHTSEEILQAGANEIHDSFVSLQTSLMVK